MAEVFISYAREDLAFVERLADALEIRGWSIFFDKKTPIGVRVDQKIHQELLAADCVVVVWSEASIESERVIEEAESAKDRNVLALIRLHDVAPPFGFRHRHYADLFSFSDGQALAGFDQLLARITALVKPRLPSQRLKPSWNLRTPSAVEPEIELIGRKRESDLLHSFFEKFQPPLVCVHGPIGIGKTYFLLDFVNLISSIPNNDLICLWYSFPSKESDESPGTSSLDFFTRSLPALGYIGEVPKNEDDRWESLASLLCSRKSLLILDDVHNLQEPSTKRSLTSKAGRIKDDSLNQLLHNLARRPVGQSLVVIGSRYPLVDLRQFRPFGGYVEMELPPLAAEAGAELLKNMNLHGGVNPKREQELLENLSRHLGGNPLTLLLIGSILSKQFNGDVRSWDDMQSEWGTAVGGEYAKKAMEWHNQRVTSEERAFLRLLGLFGRRMEEEDFRVLRRSKAGEVLAGLRVSQLNEMFSKLAEYNLLSTRSQDTQRWDGWDTHALVRQYFGRQLREECPEQWHEAHGMLFEHYKKQADHFSKMPNLQELTRMFGAVRHGCLAGRYADAYYFYRRDIAQDWVGYDTEKRGAITEALIAVSSFFEDVSFDKAVDGLERSDTAWLLARASYCLESQGKLRESAVPREQSNSVYQELYDAAAEETYEAFERARDVAFGCEELAGIRMRLGDFEIAEENASDAVRWAEVAAKSARKSEEAGTRAMPTQDKSWVPPWLRQCSTLSALGAVLHRRGKLYEAAQIFERARHIHADHEKNWVWHSEAGVRYCALRLDQANSENDLEEVLSFANKMNMWLGTDHINGLHRMIRGRALMELGKCDEAKKNLDESFVYIERSNKIQFLCEPLLVRAALWRRLSIDDAKIIEEARNDINQILEISRKCEMAPYQADAYILSAHIALDTQDTDSLHRASDDLREAHRFVRHEGDRNCYCLRLPELWLLEARLEHLRNTGHETVSKYLNAAKNHMDTMGFARLYRQLFNYQEGRWDR